MPLVPMKTMAKMVPMATTVTTVTMILIGILTLTLTQTLTQTLTLTLVTIGANEAIVANANVANGSPLTPVAPLPSDGDPGRDLAIKCNGAIGSI